MSIFLDRRSIRKYKKDVKIDKNTLNEMIEVAMRAPSSMNLQPTRLVVLESNEAKEKIRPILFGNQLQLDTASHFIVIFTDLNKYDKADKIFKSAFDLGIIPKEVMDSQLSRISEIKKTVPETKVLHDGILDGGLFAMQFMLVAREYGYDTCPIGGFNRSLINEALNIDKHLHPVLILSVGKSDESGYQSYRLPLSDTVIYK
ncbi:nitroreductase family protein [Haploplasma axanthum]|uniref:NAD(P)H nitroreductase yodC n=1 Tax=Haploplasma axanthum TaxID=29552 RepID=A0A449BEI3_HAPAX|nr:nitroreductase family protein [Haploplasma axanthum]VEU80838.1 Putative NAD(P)H nitroreductase yodC [Haploplasma axanthum]